MARRFSYPFRLNFDNSDNFENFENFEKTYI